MQSEVVTLHPAMRALTFSFIDLNNGLSTQMKSVHYSAFRQEDKCIFEKKIALESVNLFQCSGVTTY